MAHSGTAECVRDFVQYSATYVGEIVLRNVVFREGYFPARKVASAQSLASMIEAEAPICQAMLVHEFERQPLHFLLMFDHFKIFATSAGDWLLSWQS
jgi:hypothetical protein